ncbi:hypothetical protein [Cellulomonas wangsupingiae]|uniref:Integral membrane protein n=1 Tax=Cellulomonas wangsupingiae TaxID=2968085 RepID=A0ABY5K443_9CELL|nr:hypothetical protein [Cellulomonas wangsupingiae]MCC2336107.1 hypothetical protein [Cellulomonas wangsupingiae]UUI64828.1 hypothetical protein NP075_17210 [Cellulomonas wangsupingiae]
MEIVEWVRDHPVAALVITCEVAFWVFLAAAVVARYVLRRRRLSTVLLLCEPLIEVVLLVATVTDLLRGAEATWTHGLAALYLGFTVAFGRYTVHKVDGWVAWRLFDGPRPPRVPSGGRAKVVHEWKLWLRVLLAWAVAVAVLGVLLLIADDPAQRQVLLGWAGRATLVMGIWFLAGPVWQVFADSAGEDDAPDTDDAPETPADHPTSHPAHPTP